MTLKTRIQDRDSHYEQKSIVLFKTETPDDVGALAMNLIERWGLVAAMPDGEDSSGRTRLRLPTANELVTRAFDIAEATLAECSKRHHMVAIPDLNEINRDGDTARQKKRDAKDRDHTNTAAA